MGSTTGLAEPLKSRIDELLALAGGRVTVTSGLRSNAQQIALRRKHCGTSHYAIYEMPAGRCNPPTAVPGRSKHQTGEAVDLGGDLTLAAKLGKQLGLNTPVAGEPWHFQVDPKSEISGIMGAPGISTVAGGIVDLGAGVIDPFIDLLRRLLITGTVLAGGFALVVAGVYRSSTGRSLAADTADAAATVAKVAVTKKAPA